MRFGIDVAQHQLSWSDLLDRVRYAEDAGFDGAWVFDHFQPLYGDPDGPCMEGWTLMSALAAATSSIRIGSLVNGVTYRHPSVLAAQAATVDQISGGRLEFSLGAAWQEREHAQLGIDFPSVRDRARRLDEALNVIRLLWTQDGASFDGAHYTLRDATYHPRPVQRPHPPIWVGANGEKTMMPIAARHADVWHAFGSVDELKRKSALLDRLAAEAGRDPATITRSTNVSLSEPVDDIRRTVDELRTAGFDYLVASWPGEGKQRVDAFVERIVHATVKE